MTEPEAIRSSHYILKAIYNKIDPEKETLYDDVDENIVLFPSGWVMSLDREDVYPHKLPYRNDVNWMYAAAGYVADWFMFKNKAQIRHYICIKVTIDAKDKVKIRWGTSTA
jgi:hypothetical protein